LPFLLNGFRFWDKSKIFLGEAKSIFYKGIKHFFARAWQWNAEPVLLQLGFYRLEILALQIVGYIRNQ
jgi:hypothetical protein